MPGVKGGEVVWPVAQSLYGLVLSMPVERFSLFSPEGKQMSL